MGERKEADSWEQCFRRRGTMAGGKEVTGVRGLGSTGHGSKNRGHRGREGGAHASSRPILRPGDTAEVEVAMAGDVELTA